MATAILRKADRTRQHSCMSSLYVRFFRHPRCDPRLADHPARRSARTEPLAQRTRQLILLVLSMASIALLGGCTTIGVLTTWTGGNTYQPSETWACRQFDTQGRCLKWHQDCSWGYVCGEREGGKVETAEDGPEAPRCTKWRQVKADCSPWAADTPSRELPSTSGTDATERER